MYVYIIQYIIHMYIGETSLVKRKAGSRKNLRKYCIITSLMQNVLTLLGGEEREGCGCVKHYVTHILQWKTVLTRSPHTHTQPQLSMCVCGCIEVPAKREGPPIF